MLNCKQKIKHLKKQPDHKEYLLTSTQYASEQKICELAQGYNKLIKKADGQEYMLSPFAPVIMPLLMTENGLKKTTNDSEPEEGSEDNKVKSFRNTVLKDSNVTPNKDTPVNVLLKKRPQSDTSSDIERLSDQLTNKRQKTSENCQKVSSSNDKGEPQKVLNTSDLE